MSENLQNFKIDIENASLHDLKALRTALYSDIEEDYENVDCNDECISRKKIKIIDDIIKDRE